MNKSLLMRALRAIFRPSESARVAPADPDCWSSYGPSGCNRVRCQLGKKCIAAVESPSAPEAP